MHAVQRRNRMYTVKSSVDFAKTRTSTLLLGLQNMVSSSTDRPPSLKKTYPGEQHADIVKWRCITVKNNCYFTILLHPVPSYYRTTTETQCALLMEPPASLLQLESEVCGHQGTSGVHHRVS